MAPAQDHPGRRRSFRGPGTAGRAVRAAFCCLLLFPTLALLGAPELVPFRIGFAAATFQGVNENDANAAVRVWARVLAEERGIPADPEPRILQSIDDIVAALTNKTVDAINLTAEQFQAVRGQVALQGFVVARKGNSVTEEYILLVHRGSGLERLEDLRGRKLGMLQSMRTALAPVWLETCLAKAGLGRPADFFGQVTTNPKLTKIILPVFFRQLDACLVTRAGFETMVELNPQTGQQLKVLASSPPIVPVIFCFRADYSPSVRAKLLAEISRWHTTPAGRQILTIFQTDSLEERPLACLDSAFELLATHGRLCGGTNAPPASPKVALEQPEGGAQ
jgi:ABC-type phosphate/phosphonate transport system substrate-binding protein